MSGSGDAEFIAFQLGRMATFENTTITDVQDGGGSPSISTSTAARAHPRTKAGTVLGSRFQPQDRAIMIAGGEQDVPTLIGRSPYIF